MLQVEFLFSGHIDYWSGDGRQWEDNAGCLFATYSTDTSLRDIVNQWVDDFEQGGDCDSMSADSADVRQAILDMLSESGRADYESAELCEWSEQYADDLGLKAGVPIEEQLHSNEDIYNTFHKWGMMTLEELPVVIILVRELEGE